MRAFQLIADAQIVAAIQAGDFENLPGLGRPIPDEPLNYDPNAWIREKMRLEGLRISSSASSPCEKRSGNFSEAT